MEDTWFSRDLPVLDAAISLAEESAIGFPRAGGIAKRTGFDVRDVAKAMDAMDGAYFRVQRYMSGGDPSPWHVSEFTPKARRAVGQWPTPENVADRLLAALEQAASETADEEERGRFRRAADSLKGLGRDVLPEVIANVITKGAMGL